MAWRIGTRNLKIAGKEDCEARVVEEIQDGQSASSNDGALLDHPERNEGNGGELGIPEKKDANDDQADDEHSYE